MPEVEGSEVCGGIGEKRSNLLSLLDDQKRADIGKGTYAHEPFAVEGDT